MSTSTSSPLFSRKFVRKARYAELLAREHGYFDFEFLKQVPDEYRNSCFGLLSASKAQLRQDLFALIQSDFKREGFFVEFGATDGVELNNSHLLEKQFGWSGILAEPARGWHSDLNRNRNCIIDKRCVWSVTGENLRFTEAPRGENSAISSFTKTRRKLRGQNYDVETISLNDLLDSHNAPAHIDYMSVDTEGSELDILSAVDFARWSFGCLTVEHNFAPQRDGIHALLTANGYTRVWEKVSRFDDWYIKTP